MANFHIVTRWQFGDTTPGSYRNFPRPVSGLATEFRNFHRSPPVVQSINFFVPVARVPVCNVHSGVLQVHHALGWHLSVYFPMISQRSISLLPRSFFSFSTPFFLLVSVSFFFFSLVLLHDSTSTRRNTHACMHACVEFTAPRGWEEGGGGDEIALKTAITLSTFSTVLRDDYLPPCVTFQLVGRVF